MGELILQQKQFVFTRLMAELIGHAYSEGYTMTVGEAWRPPETAAIYAKRGKGIKGSLHTSRLAIDLNLFKGGKYLTGSESYRSLGEYWESLSKKPEYECCWGGRFQDGNHFSMSYGGRK